MRDRLRSCFAFAPLPVYYDRYSFTNPLFVAAHLPDSCRLARVRDSSAVQACWPEPALR